MTTGDALVRGPGVDIPLPSPDAGVTQGRGGRAQAQRAPLGGVPLPPSGLRPAIARHAGRGQSMRTYVRMGPGPYRPVSELEDALARGELDMAIGHAKEVADKRGRPIDLDLALRFLPLVASVSEWRSTMPGLYAGSGDGSARPRSPRLTKQPSWRRRSPTYRPSRARGRRLGRRYVAQVEPSAGEGTGRSGSGHPRPTDVMQR
jgi:hypothetical protein